MNKRNLHTVIAAALLLTYALTPLFAEDETPAPQANPAPDVNLPGTVEGAGTYFDVNDSDYLNIAVQSTEPVRLSLESVPEVVTMCIEAAEGATSTQLTLSGFEPLTTYYRYQDNYHNVTPFTTDAAGSCSYVQALSGPHLVFFRESPGTKYIPSDTSIGTWNPLNRVYTLTTDVYETIQIDEDDLTLDGDGHSVTQISSGGTHGVFLSGRTGVTVKNLNVTKYNYGIYLYSSNNCTLANNTAGASRNCGFYLRYSDNCTLTHNAASDHGSHGFMLTQSQNPNLSHNNASNNRYRGIYLNLCPNGSLTNNTCSNHVEPDHNTGAGFYIYRSAGATLTGNVASDNDNGFYFGGYESNSNMTITANTATNNIYGFYLYYSGGNTLTGNTLTGNTYNFYIMGQYVQNIDTTNTLDGKPMYYIVGETGTVYDGLNAGAFYAISCNTIAVRNVTVNASSWDGLHLYNTRNSTIENVSVSGDYYYGIYLANCSNNHLTANAASNSTYGLYLAGCSYNTLRNNTLSGNAYNFGVYSRYENDIDTTNTVNGKPIYYVQNAPPGTVYDASTNAGAFYAINCDGITIKDLTLQNNYCGLLLHRTTNSTVENVSASNNYHGIMLWQCGYYYTSANNLLVNNNASNNDAYGIYVYYSPGNTLMKNVANSNSLGISVQNYSAENKLIENAASYNGQTGVYVGYGNDKTELTNNTAVSNTNNGFDFSYSDDNVLSGNTAASNGAHGFSFNWCNGNTLQANTAILNAIGFRVEYCQDFTITENLANSNTYTGFYMLHNYFIYSWYGTPPLPHSILNNTASENGQGFRIYYQMGDIISGNLAVSNQYGFYFYNTYDDDLHDNASSDNSAYGIYLYRSETCSIYNNNFLNNAAQAYAYNSPTCVFNLPVPIGGNHWSDWTTPDSDGDGFVDNPYVFTGGQDNLPWAQKNGWLNQPPSANAGDNLEIASAAQPFTVVEGAAADPDGDLLSYRWLEAADVLLDWTPVGPGGQAHLDLGAVPYFSIGIHTLTLEVTDGLLNASDKMILTVENSPPDAQPAPTSQVVEFGVDYINVVADVADFDGDTLYYEWIKDGEVLASGAVATPVGGDVVPVPDLVIEPGDSRFGLGEHQIQFLVSDAVNEPVSTFVTVTVQDTTAPTLAPVPSVTILWPPNHQLHCVLIQANACDKGGGPVLLTLEVASSEPPDTTADGHTIPDYYIDSVDSETGIIQLSLRSERQGSGNGRLYTVQITATDESGNSSVASVAISAPHDKRKR